LDRENNRPERPDEHGPMYMAIERALWALGPALLLFMLVGHLSTQPAREAAAADVAIEIAAENLAHCTKWGMPAGGAEHGSCVRDLVGIRARAEQRLRDQIASEF
jgi:hypothetical protein